MRPGDNKSGIMLPPPGRIPDGLLLPEREPMLLELVRVLAALYGVATAPGRAANDIPSLVSASDALMP